jgi:DNA-binding transcriptional ArsR family regulator
VCIYVLVYVRVVVNSVQQKLTAISESNRFRIVELLRDGPQPVGGIVDALGLGQPQVSRHLRLLAEAGVVEVTKRAQQRIYRLHPESMRELSDWVQGFAALWSERMDRLGSFLEDHDRAPDETNQ